mmetsp:Transcript_46502/g.104824  ORF Transcript_46502/g.104824 Transcript_46502/m.104824 type:complete len:226 (+) Transcript_46502:754-1431(+)
MRRDQRGEAGWDGSGLDGAGQDVTPFHTVSSDRIPLAILSTRMAVDEHFGHFISVARLRNTHGTRCKRPKLCAAQPAETHMWHHEDAGIGFNVFRAVVGQNASAIYVPVPAHYNDPGIIERSNPLDSNDQIWSMRAIFTHGVKLPLHYRILRHSLLAAQHARSRCRPKAVHLDPLGRNVADFLRCPNPHQRWNVQRHTVPCGAAPQAEMEHVSPASRTKFGMPSV